LILVGFFGVLARAPSVVHPLYCAMAAVSATVIVMVRRPMNTKVMRRRLADRGGSILRMSANLLSFVVNSVCHRGNAGDCARADADGRCLNEYHPDRARVVGPDACRVRHRARYFAELSKDR